MRRASPLAVLGSGLALLAAPALHAQPDPTPAAAYAPLDVGTVREYRLADQSGTTVFGYRRETVVRDTAIAGTTWHVVRVQAFAANRTRTSDALRLDRFDAALANVLQRTAAGTTPRYPCRLDLDLTAAGTFPACRIGVSYGKGPGTVLGVATTRLTFGYDFGSIQVAAGFGLVSTVDEGVFTTLVYARVGGQEAGTRVDGLPSRPDPTPPADYYPLEVGNEWIYRFTERSVNGTSDVYVRRRVLREAAVGGQTYAVDQSCIYNNLDASPTWACEPERLVRFDPATTNVVLGSATGESIYVCNLGADFFDTRPAPSSCRGSYVGYQPATVEIGGVIYTAPSLKVPSVPTLGGGPPGFVAGIGQTPGEPGPFRTSRFEFARIRGVEYGVRPAVAGEADAAPDGVLALTAAPNPTSGTLRLALALPAAQTVTAEAFDALGRRVWQASLPMAAGPQTVDIDASAWAPGVYVVRVVAGQAAATARVVRR